MDDEAATGEARDVGGDAESGRRRFLKQAGVGAAASGALWVAPQVLGSRHVAAAAATGSPPDPPDPPDLPAPKWTNVTPITGSPPSRYLHAMARQGAGSVVLFGGYREDPGDHYFNDTWVWDGSDWEQQSPSTVPAPRFRHTMALDPSDKVIMQGWNPNLGPPYYGNDYWFWFWDGNDWTKEYDSYGGWPNTQYGSAMSADASGNVVWHGGIAAPWTNGWWVGTEVWDGNTFENQSPPRHRPLATAMPWPWTPWAR